MALIIVLFALMLLTGIGLGLMYMTTTETGIDSNFRGEQQAYYASKAGLEEARDRLRYNPCAGCVGAYSNNAQYDITSANFYAAPPTASGWALPTTAPPPFTASVVYIVNSSGAADPVTPWTPNTPYFDDELCHENFTGLGLQATAATVPCAQAAPAGNTWYKALNSFDPNTGT
ncbi:MAG TPA: pilus assembly PilX N-terminal domain-containing protein, partial [Terriglobales bacterium]|nr:pilus assembly PilX N-terminal domain-containing protein [Terriglobales bacterium]